MAASGKVTSFDMYAEYEKCNASGHEFQPSHVPLDFAHPFKPFPNSYVPFDFSRNIKWYYFPDLQPNWSLRFILVLIASSLAALSVLFLILTPFTKSTNLALVGSVFLLLAALVAMVARNVVANDNFRNTVCRVFSKHLTAMDMWKTNPGPSHESKDVFYKEKTFLGDLRVLRDGDVELGTSTVDPYVPEVSTKASAPMTENVAVEHAPLQ